MTCRICDHPGVVMKPFKALLLTSLVLGACEKSNDITQLHEEAVATAKYYGPRVDDMMKRRDAIFQRGRNVPGNLPDVPDIVKLIGEAGDKINEMHGIASPGPDGKSAIEKQADGFLKDGKIEELGKLIDDSHEKLDDDWTVANDDLSKVEGWLWQYEQGHLGAAPIAQPPPPPPEQPPATAGSNAAPEAGSAGTPPKAGEPKVEDKKAGSGAAAPKADDKKAEKKPADDKKAAPKADEKKAAPKADEKKAEKKPADAKAGSAAK